MEYDKIFKHTRSGAIWRVSIDKENGYVYALCDSVRGITDHYGPLTIKLSTWQKNIELGYLVEEKEIIKK